MSQSILFLSRLPGCPYHVRLDTFQHLGVALAAPLGSNLAKDGMDGRGGANMGRVDLELLLADALLLLLVNGVHWAAGGLGTHELEGQWLADGQGLRATGGQSA